MEISAADLEVPAVPDAMIGEASLPDGRLGGQAMREAAFDKAYGSFEGDALRGEDQVDVVGHDDEGMKFVVVFSAIVLEGFKEEFCVGRNLEETAAIVGRGGDKKCAGA
jgi:hypothetical protein